MEHTEVKINNLIHVSTFLKETGMTWADFYPFFNAGAVTGFIDIDGRTFIDRANVDIAYRRNGYKFGLWKELGGRAVSVDVPAFIKMRNKQAKPITAEKMANGCTLSPPGSNG